MKFSFFHQAPMIRLLIPLSIGICTSNFYSFNWSIVATFFAIICLALIILNKYYTPYKLQWRVGISFTSAFFLLGILLPVTHNELFKQSHFSKLTHPNILLLRLDDPGSVAKQSTKYRCIVFGTIDNQKHQYSASGNVMLYIQSSTADAKLHYGDVIAVQQNLFKKIPPPQNPEEFDYKKYLHLNNIHYAGYIRNDQFRLLPMNLGNPFLKWSYQLQQYFSTILVTYIQSPNETGVAQALLYGFDDDIDPETINAYAQTGTLHVLAVSGMHVGIIFLILGFILKPLNKNKNTKLIKNIILLLGLWCYSLLCGMSPSILRATVMFSSIIFGGMLNRQSNIYNTLAASAFLLLCWDPNILFNVGFQLSYLAVLAIVSLQPFIYNWFIPRTWLMDQIWKISSVSLAAQVFTLPISLLYFHQFPNCFLISNLLIIPLTTIILYGGMLLLAFSKITIIAIWLGKALMYTIYFTNALASFLQKMPYAYTDGIHISLLQCLLLYGFFISGITYFLYRQTLYLKFSLITCIAFFIQSGIQQTTSSTQQNIVAYHIPHHTAIRIISGNNSLLYIDSSLYVNNQKVKFHLLPHYWSKQIKHETIVYTSYQSQCLTFNHTKILCSGVGYPDAKNMTYPFFIVSNPFDTFAFRKIKCKVAVITGHIRPAEQLLITQFLWRKKIPYYNVADSAAIELNL